MYVLQNAAVALSALTALVSLHTPQGSAWFWAGAACTIGIGSISSVGAQGSALSVEKEWTTVLCQGDSTALAKLNSGEFFASLEKVLQCNLDIVLVVRMSLMCLYIHNGCSPRCSLPPYSKDSGLK